MDPHNIVKYKLKHICHTDICITHPPSPTHLHLSHRHLHHLLHTPHHPLYLHHSLHTPLPSLPHTSTHLHICLPACRIYISPITTSVVRHPVQGNAQKRFAPKTFCAKNILCQIRHTLCAKSDICFAPNPIWFYAKSLLCLMFWYATYRATVQLTYLLNAWFLSRKSLGQPKIHLCFSSLRS